ncbi:transposase [Parvimonas sp. D9]|uniref:transposase n=1 Tax=Parvimonas sp. D9 TaxID=3110689 RepID=UPI002B476719|nr:transposase [Parvimonas sp. D9]MEB3058918.1 transposase [Parvimonas sp. D9]
MYGFLRKGLKEIRVKKIVMDAGYKTPAIVKMLIDDKIQLVLPYTSPKGKRKERFYPKDYVYDKYYDCYICPENEILKYSTTTREGYREYKSDRKKCRKCKNLEKCTESRNKQKVITRHIWKKYLEECEEYRYTKRGKEEYKRRKETIERTFKTVKEYHGFRYTNEKGKAKMQIKALLTFACLNMKKLANMMSRLGRKRPNFLIFKEFYKNFKILTNFQMIFN